MTVSAHSGGIGTLGAFVLDVNQLETCSLFWSQALGVDVLFQEENIQGLGHEGEPPLIPTASLNFFSCFELYLSLP